MNRNANGPVLIVDDDRDFTFFLEVVFRVSGFQTDVKALHSGEELLAWLGTNQQPNLILLDIRMPQRSGFDVLISLKGDTDLQAIPIVMLTISSSLWDVQTAYQHGANAYIIKPRTFEGLQARMELLSHYWFD